MKPTFPTITVKLTGTDGNAFMVIGRVTRALRDAGHVTAANTFAKDAMTCESYDELLQFAMKTVDVE